jgi:iron complex outermembrane receptor protein
MPRRNPSLTSLRTRRLPLAAALLSALPFWSALPALAQTSPPAAEPDTGRLQTVTVTATKRLQPLQSTPIAISVLNGGALEEANLNNLAAITTQTPTVNFRTNASNKDSALFIRGVGTISTSPGVEPTVSTVLDGVVTSRPGQATLDLVEIDRIEILRGPQGTLFGKNASAGVINIVTRAPSAQREGYVDLAYFQGNERRIRLGGSGELATGLLRGSISAMAGKFDGNVTNVFDGSKVNGYDRKGIRGRLDITPTPSLKLVLIADHTKALDDTPTGVAYSTNVTTFPTGAVTANPLFGAALAPVVASQRTGRSTARCTPACRTPTRASRCRPTGRWAATRSRRSRRCASGRTNSSRTRTGSLPCTGSSTASPTAARSTSSRRHRSCASRRRSAASSTTWRGCSTSRARTPNSTGAT